MTVQRSQGQTAKNVIYVTDERTSGAELLVGVTRATQGVLLIAREREHLHEVVSRSGEKHIAHKVAGESPAVESVRDAKAEKAQLSSLSLGL